jgi:HNH endonuclease
VARLKVERFGSIAAARCEDPAYAVPGGRGGKVYGDHVIELKDDPSLALVGSNILFRCPVCHGRKTIETRVARYGLNC